MKINPLDWEIEHCSNIRRMTFFALSGELNKKIPPRLIYKPMQPSLH
jgi:hypothetical protein